MYLVPQGNPPFVYIAATQLGVAARFPSKHAHLLGNLDMANHNANINMRAKELVTFYQLLLQDKSHEDMLILRHEAMHTGLDLSVEAAKYLVDYSKKREALLSAPRITSLAAPEDGVAGGSSTGGCRRIEGWLEKQGHLVKNWKRRWFVLEFPVLTYYRSPTDKTPRGTVQCDEVTLSDKLHASMFGSVGSGGRQFCFGIFHPQRKTYILSAVDGPAMMVWVSGIRHKLKLGLIDFDELEVLGKGNFGKVLLVRRKVKGDLYAMKVLNKDEIIRRKDVGHTMTERKALQNIRHPFIVQLHFAFQTGNKLFLVMDYVPGGDLYYHLKKQKKFPESVVKLWVAELTDALGYVHSLHHVFRDLKQENVLLDADGHVHLADFGLSKEVESFDQRLTTFCGTPYYLAPEIIAVPKQKKRIQISGGSHKDLIGYSKDVDWWALAVLTFELLVGDPPFVGRNIQAVYHSIIALPHSQVERRLKEGSISVSEDAVAFVLSMLDRDPSKRLGNSPIKHR
ncbi:AGC family serine/threonine-protein kinase [bacterium]|nr:AGC family serine/threonine-protein kinase [bacterium]